LGVCDKDFIVLSGDDEIAVDMVKAGGRGVISVVSNIIPEHMHNLMQWALSNNDERAKALNTALKPLYDAMSLETNPIPVKWALHQQGKIDKGIRLPLQPFAVQYRYRLKRLLDSLEAGTHAS